MNLNVKLTQEEYDKLLEKAKSQVRDTLTKEALKNYLADINENFSIIEIIRLLNIYDRYGKLMNEIKEGGPYDSHGRKRDMCRHDNFLISLYTLLYEDVR